MLLLAVVALVLPAVFQLVEGGGLPSPTEESKQFSSDLETMSIAVAVVLLFTYLIGLLFSLRTHADLFNPHRAEDEEDGPEPWSVRRAVIMLTIAGIAVGVMSEILVGSISEASEDIGLSPFFVGVIVVAIVGSAAEHWVAIYFANRNKMDLSVNISIGSSAQIALFAAPVLVLLSFVIGDFPMALVFNGFELAAVLLAVMIAIHVAHDGESNGSRACSCSRSTSSSRSPSSSSKSESGSRAQVTRAAAGRNAARLSCTGRSARPSSAGRHPS